MQRANLIYLQKCIPENKIFNKENTMVLRSVRNKSKCELLLSSGEEGKFK